MSLFASLWLLAAMVAQAVDPSDARHAPGLKLTIESGGASDVRIARLAAIAVPAGTTPSSLLKPGPFSATFVGFINLKIRGDFYFSALGNGSIELIVNNQPVLKSFDEPSARVRMKKGPNPIVFRYTPPAAGDAFVRLYWNEKDRPAEPVSPLALSHDANDASLAPAEQLRRGRELVVELRCAKCHVDPAVPRFDAPDLSDAGWTFKPSWTPRWVLDPKSVRRDATMPKVIRAEQDARDVAAFLATLLPRGMMPPPWVEAVDVPAGAHLFTGLGCIACHGDAQQLPLKYVRQKWRPAALVDYLRAPQRRYLWTRMGDFKLSDDEARRLAAFLVDRADPPVADELPADPMRGRELFASSGCANCHPIDAVKPTVRVTPLRELRDLTAGCLDDDADSDVGTRAPDFQMSADDLAAIRAIGKANWRGLDSQAPTIDLAQREMRQLNCVACHVHDAQQDAWSGLRAQIDAIESAHPARDVLPMSGDQTRPSLTWTGEKLRAEWTTRFIGGRIEYKPRPWLAARMPAFQLVRASRIAIGLSLEHGFLLDEPDEPPIDEHLAERGRKLAGRNGGFSCNACHAIGTAPPTSAFEAQGPNFMFTRARMREDFYHRWARNPQRYEPGTRMPQYSDAQGKTPLKEFFDGDAAQQFRAIWEYLRAGERIAPAE